jgi:hypothetical protein
MIYFPETINTVSTMSPIHSLASSQLCTPLTLCMLASSSREGVVSLDLFLSSHLIMSSLFPYLGPTDAPCSRLGNPAPLSPKWRPHSQGPRTLPYRDPEQILPIKNYTFWTHWSILSVVSMTNSINRYYRYWSIADFVYIHNVRIRIRTGTG